MCRSFGFSLLVHRNVQNLNQLDEDVPLAAVKTNKTTRPLPKPPTDIITGQSTSRTGKRLPIPPSTPSYSTRVIPNVPTAIRSPPPPPVQSRAMFPSGFIDEVSGYSKMTDYLQNNNNHIGHSVNYEYAPRPASRRGRYCSPVESFQDLHYGDIDYKTFKRTDGEGNCGTEGEGSMEEYDISEVSPLEFDVEEEEMTRELIKMLDF